jgi:hypothetical protein
MLPGIAGLAGFAGTAGGGGGGPGHRYWRVNVTANNGDSVLVINELELFDATTGAKATGGTKSASSELNASYVAGNAFDGDFLSGGAGTVWATNSSASGWLQVDYGAGNEKDIRAFTIWSRVGFASQAPKDFTLQYSDNGSSWTTLITVTNQTSWLDREARTFVSSTPSYTGSPWGDHLYYRWYILENNSSGASALGELEIRASAGGADQTSGSGTASASSTDSTFTASKAFDDNTSTLWASTTTPVWIKYQAPSAIGFAQIAMRARHDGFESSTPKRFVLQFSDDDSNWFTCMQRTSETAWSASEIRAFTDPAYI